MSRETRHSGLAWHVHHDSLIEYCYDIEERRHYIRTYKPIGEVKVRLDRLAFVQRQLGDEQAGQAAKQARQAAEQAWQATEQERQAAKQARQAAEQAWQATEQERQAAKQAWQATEQAWFDSIPPEELEAAHREECPDCPWDGTTLFPEKGATGEGRTV